MEKIKVLIVDDHILIRDGIKALLKLIANIEVVGEADNGRDALEKVKEFDPDIVLMDLSMPVMDGLEATRRIKKEFPRTQVLALTQHEDSEYVIPVIEAGARGFVTKMVAFSELAAAIDAVFHGKSYLSPSAAMALVSEYQVKTENTGSKDAYENLTDREREVIKLIVEGYTSPEIAGLLFISQNTVESYKSSLMNKLNIHNKTELIKYALRKKIISL